MTVSALDIISVDELKAEFTLPSTHTSEDSRFESFIRTAADRVAEDTGLALIDKVDDEYVDFPPNGSPMCIPVFDFHFDNQNAAHEIRYWDVNGNLNDLPNAVIHSNQVGRVVQLRKGIVLYNSGDWPADRLPGTRAVVVGTKGLQIDEIPNGIKDAMIIYARFMYTGEREVPSAYYALIQPYKRVEEV